jgi:NDP-sugar pyrophosphorylase family protein
MEKQESTHDWKGNKNIKCVILCAGKGTRLIPHSLDIPKPMTIICEKPLLGHIVDYWKKYTNNFVFVVGYKKEQIIEYVKSMDIDYEFVEQKEQKGLAHALYQAKDVVGENFIVILGDCLITGDIHIPENMTNGVGMWQNHNPIYMKENFSIEHNNNIIHRMVEKPENSPTTSRCGMGIYFFNKDIFNYIRTANTTDITAIMQQMIDGGKKFTPVIFNGHYININYPQDIKEAENNLQNR